MRSKLHLFRKGETSFVVFIAFVLAGLLVGVAIFSATYSLRDREANVAQRELITLQSILAFAPILDSQGEFSITYKPDPKFEYQITDERINVKANKLIRTGKYAGSNHAIVIAEQGDSFVIKSE